MTISELYRREQEAMHRTHNDYGVACLQYVDTLVKIITERGITTMLDYGAGKGRIVPALAQALPEGGPGLTINLYDPAIPDIAERPERAELVTCIDVLEHVEPEYTVAVLDEIVHCTEKIAFITIGLQPAAKKLSDGRNAHINLRPVEEWIALLIERFRFVYAVNKRHTLLFVGKPL